MKSLKWKIVLIFAVICLVATVGTSLLGVQTSFNTSDKIVQVQFEDKLKSAEQMLAIYLNKEFGGMHLSADGQDLVDSSNETIYGRNTSLDELSKSMNVVSTVFIKQNNDYRRILTSILDEQGKRAVDTKLDSSGAAYSALNKGETFIGETNILGSDYITIYVPMYDSVQQQKVIGAYFVGTPSSNVTALQSGAKTHTLTSVGILLLISLVIIVAICYFVGNSMAKPIKNITAAATEIAKGNFDVSLSVKTKDEVGQLAASFGETIAQLTNYQEYIDEISDTLEKISNGQLTVQLQKDYAGQFKKLKDHMDGLINSFNKTLLKIRNATDQVYNGADQVSSGAQSLSQGATEQASAVQEISASVTDISNRIHENANSANEASQKATDANTEMNRSTQFANDLLHALEDINQKSSEISKIIKVINDIAFQTNILALNASVEAARAGTAGKGFSVVADEVRNLAGKSANSAKEIEHLIEEALQSVQAGSEIAEKTADSISNSAKITKEAVTEIQKIAVSSKEQSQMVQEISSGIEQISSVVQTTAATAEESAATSEELSGQSSILDEYIKRFHLKEES